jgi:hypothetical protein
MEAFQHPAPRRDTDAQVNMTQLRCAATTNEVAGTLRHREEAGVDNFSDFICTGCGEPIGQEPYCASFGRQGARAAPEPLWPESVFHRRCMADYFDANADRD